MPGASGRRRDALHWHSEGTVHLLTRGLCRLDPTFLFFQSCLYLIFSIFNLEYTPPPERSAPSPSLPPVPVGITPLGVNMAVVLGISLCLAVILSTVVVTVWRKFCQAPQCSSVRRGSVHSPGGRKLSDEASICANSLQRPSVSDGHGTLRATGANVAQETAPVLGNPPVAQTLVTPVSQDPERLSPTGQKMLPTVFG